MIRSASALAGAVLGASVAQATISVPTVPVGFVGNAPDPATGYGSVGYEYRIGTTEVTNAQYAAFLNAVAATDTHALYNAGMAGTTGGIVRDGVDGGYTYSTTTGREAHPVNYVSFWDACRFSNWLHNGQPTGAQDNSTTEDGAYTLTPGTIADNSVTRNVGARWGVPSENEWYKAAYYQPASNGGDADDYWLFGTSGNTITLAQANYNAALADTTPAGTYAPNFSGAFDMAGNLWEWNNSVPQQGRRGLRGGSFLNNNNILRSDFVYDFDFFSYDHNEVIGFRVAEIPTPSSIALLAIGGAISSRRRRLARLPE